MLLTPATRKPELPLSPITRRLMMEAALAKARARRQAAYVALSANGEVKNDRIDNLDKLNQKAI